MQERVDVTELLRIFDMNTRVLRNSERKYSGQKYDADSTTLHFEYVTDFLKVPVPNVTWIPYIIFNVPDDEGNPITYSFDGYTFVLPWDVTSRVTKSRRVEYQLWFVRQTTHTDEGTGVPVVDDTDYLISEIDSVVLKPSIPERPKQRTIIDPEDFNVPPNPPAYNPSVEPSIVGWIELWKSIGVVVPTDGSVLSGVDENGHITLTLKTYGGTNDTVVTFASPALVDGKIPVEFLPTGNTAGKIPLIASEIKDGRSLVYSQALGGFVDGSTITPTSDKTWAELQAMESAYVPDPTSQYYIMEGTVYNCTTVGTYDGVDYAPGTNWVWEVVRESGTVVSGHWEPLTAGIELITDWQYASDTVAPSSLLTKNTLDAKLDDVQLVTSWQVTPDNTHIASEKLTKDSLDAKLDDSQLVTSWQSPVSDSNIASEKLTKDAIDTKLDKVTSSNAYARLYGVDTLGAQAMYNLDAGKNGSTVAWRDAQGHLVAESPSLAGHVATKKYVDDADTGISTTLTSHINNTDNPHNVTKAQVGLGDVENHQMDSVPTSESTNYVRSGGAYSAVQGVQGNLDTHEARTDNPHSVNATQVGLGSVVNATMDSTPSENSTNYVSSGGVFSALALKQDNMTAGTDYVAHSTSASVVYATNGSAVDTPVPYSVSATGSAIVQRGATGQITVPTTPDMDTDAASKAFVNSSIATNTATFLGTYKALADPQNPTMSLGFTQAQVDTMTDPDSSASAAIATALAQKISNPSVNDYCFVEMDFTDPATSPDEYRRYKFSGTTWLYEYTLNNSSFTQAQWDAINSTITSTKVAAYDAYATNKLDASTVFATINGTSVKGSTAFSLQTPLTAGTDYQTPLTAGTDYQVPLVSGTNIKTINNSSILGSGNVSVQAPLTFDSTPTADSTNPVTSGGVKTALDGKVDKVTSEGTNRVYGVSGQGSQTMFSVYDTAEAWTVPRRGASGVLKVGTPSDNADATTKLYVDTADAAKVTGPSSSVSDDVVLFDGTTGKLVKDSGKTLGASIPAITANQDEGKALVVNSTGTAFEFGEAGKVDDVQINGTSILSNKVANITVDSAPTTNSTNLVQSGGVKTALDAKLDDTQLVTSWGTSDANATDSNIASAKLTKDSLDEKVPINYTANGFGNGVTKAYINQNGTNSAMWIANTATQYALAVRRGSPSYNFDVGTPTLDTECANKAYVDSAISTSTANFLGTLDVVTDLGLTTSATNSDIATALGSYTFSTTPTNNDYVIVTVNVSTTTDIDEYRRFKYNGSAWNYEYTINNTAFSSTQWDAINSGANTTNIGAIADKLDKVTHAGQGYYVYANETGQIQLPCQTEPNQYTIAYRGSGGTLNVATPTADSHAATKLYVDTADANKITGPASSTADHILTFSDATGKVAKDSGYTIATSVPSGAVFTDEKVNQLARADDINRPILLGSAMATDTNSNTYKNLSKFYANTSTGTITATTFNGALDWSNVTNKPTIPEGATVDASFSKTSENAVQNKTISNTLAGGTSGQVLTKSSGTDWDFTWATVSATDEKVKQIYDNSAGPYPIIFGDGGNTLVTQAVYKNTKMTVSPSTGTITATTFSGALTGNVTGNCSGSAGSVAYSGITNNPFTVTDVNVSEVN